ncbi:SAM-dependent methyltransferase [Chamaesiphon sp. OTE_20_metabat_361]|uniref:SAM-dependent methyltransferase n=1 Tax=Chamaesiphon sp. OTE_20_metabat_361 TaxID=2964689 RepID=UPI00286CD4CF|nr:SAM-dependent methyltransferase [Chamaesiphon sp. OTE_20_metabat_361]
MIRTTPKTKVEYGDFQTPIELAELICQKLIELGVNPDAIVEPTCGIGNFINASSRLFLSTDKILGIEINQQYVEEIKTRQQLDRDQRIEIIEADFFQFDWRSQLDKLDGQLLVIGNFPWVTNSQQGVIGGKNLPSKVNFQDHIGLDAITGKSNFDISEWMLIQSIEWFQQRGGYLSMLCKTSVARKILNHLRNRNLNLAYCASYNIDAKKYFNASVESCLLFCKFDGISTNYFCDVFDSLESTEYKRIGYRHNILVRDVIIFDRVSELYHPTPELKWRSGVKHDCSSVMELRKIDSKLINGFGDAVDIEDTYLFPLLKGSDVAQNRIQNTDRYVLVTQRFVGEPTDAIEYLAPKTWRYLESHAKYLDNRKSKIYLKNPRFSIFGIGSYTFAPWKIAICGLYKKLEFRLIGQLNDRGVIFDDTVYFIGFDDRASACQAFDSLTSTPVRDFYSSLIFWDEKRPIKSSILNSLNLAASSDHYRLS